MKLLSNFSHYLPRPADRSAKVLGLLLAGMMATAGALAEKPEGNGGGKHDKKGKHAQKNAQRAEVETVPSGGYFADGQRTVVHTYYAEQYRKGRCPPGLAKKNNGCMPPGQARKWAIGQPLPRDIVYYSVPPPVIVQLGAPPAGHRYVRVATDILLIAIGTGMVIDAINDLGQI